MGSDGRRTARAVVGVVLALAGALGAASPAAAAIPGATLTGTVTSPDGPVAGASVQLISVDDGGSWLHYTSTGADGTYALEGVDPTVRWIVAFGAPRGSGLLSEFHDGVTEQAAATPVTFAAGTPNVLNPVLGRSATIRGRVTDEAGAPVGAVAISAHATTGSGSAFTSTGADGRYVLSTDLPPGAWTVHADSYDPGHVPATPRSTTLSAGQSRTVDFVLESAGRVAVRYTGPAATGPRDVWVGTVEQSVRTLDAGGGSTVELGSLRAGTVRVAFARASGETPYVPQFYRSSGTPTTDLAQASGVTVRKNGTTSITTGLLTGGSITGRVTDPAGAPVAGRMVVAFVDGQDHATRSTWTQDDGSYRIQGLLPGWYQVAVPWSTPGGSDTFHRTGVKPATPNVQVTGTSTTSGIDITVGARFLDVQPGAPFAADIEWLATQGITQGSVDPATGDARFDPAGPVRREAMAAFLYRAAGSPAFTPPRVSPFRDVPTTAPFFTEIAWLADRGIATGTPVGGTGVEFRPGQDVSREAMAVFLYRAEGSPAFTPPTVSPFRDVPTTAPFYREIAWLASAGISTGTDVGGGVKEFRPAESVRREAMAAFLHRAAAVGS